MLDYKKYKEIVKTIHSHTAEDLQEWIDSYHQRIAQAEQEESCQPVPRRSVGKLNGTPSSAAKSKSVPVKTTKVTPPSKVRARNSAKSRATANTW